jgi:hypothetical protein
MRNGTIAVGSAVAPAFAMTTTAMAFAQGGGAHFAGAYFGTAACGFAAAAAGIAAGVLAGKWEANWSQ